MKFLGNSLTAAVVAFLAIAIAAPAAISLSHALVPVLLVGIIGGGALRLLWFKTRRW